MESAELQNRSRELASLVREIENKGWTPATSSNFSFRTRDHEKSFCAISRSGVDKSKFQANDFILVDENLEWREPQEAKPSAESLIHTSLYQWDRSIEFILHTHSVSATVLGMNENSEEIGFQGYEMIKAFSEFKSHEESLICPVFENSQDMPSFSNDLSVFLKKATKPIKGFLIRGHGLYTWGQSLAEAKRHLEAWEFLFACRLKERGLRDA